MSSRTPTHTLFRVLAGAGAALSLLAGAAPVRAEDADFQQWTLFTVQKELSDRWRAYFEVQPRFGSDIAGSGVHGVERLLVRPAIGYRITPELSVWQGYGWTPLFMPTFRDEHRLFQQFLYEDTWGKTGFTNRLRIEERFIEDAGDTAYRIRNMVRLSHPISADRRWSAIVYDELFYNLNSVFNGPAAGYDRNRIFVGVGRQVNPHLRFETGYLQEQANAPSTSPNRRLHIWLTSFNWKL